jgi:tetratricopeptide (TPR) repeat protein
MKQAIAFAVLAAVAVIVPASDDGAAAGLGRLDFTVTGSPQCQRLFRRGMLEMHSFQYDQAQVSFEAALRADARCAMAAWGLAMSHEHPLWGGRDVAKSRAALARVQGEERLTARERDWLAVARALLSVDDMEAAHKAWLQAAARMHDAHPADDEVALHHALALIANYDGVKGKQREMLKAGAIALDVHRRRPDHPAGAHYAIHAFDHQDSAILALPAARAYARIAPASAHALHMPSHTFVHLGMWGEVVPSNARAFAASKQAARRLNQGPDKWDWHAYGWQVAAHLELGQWREAARLVDDVKALLATNDSPDLRVAYSFMALNLVSSTGRWGDAEALSAPLLAPLRSEGTTGQVVCGEHAPGGSGYQRGPYVLVGRVLAHRMRAEAALRSGDAAAAQARAKDTVAVLDQMKPWGPRPRDRTQADLLQVRARHVAEKSPDSQQAALQALEKFVQELAGQPVAGPTFNHTPAEIYAEALTAAGQHAAALESYEKVLDVRPNRALALLGAARAARATGDAAKARTRYATLAALWKNADADLPLLAEVREGAR